MRFANVGLHVLWDRAERWGGRVHLLTWVLELFGWRQVLVSLLATVAGAAWAGIRELPGPVILAVSLGVFASMLIIVRIAIWSSDRFCIAELARSEAKGSPAESNGARVGDTKAKTSPPQQTAAVHVALDVPIQSPFTERFREDWEKVALNLEKLFTIQTGTICLKFLPDTKDKLADRLLLILFAYKKICGMNEVSFDIANRIMPRDAWRVFEIAGGGTDTSSAAAVARDHLSEYVERVGLSKGGYLRLNASGYTKAYMLAQDLIDRA